MLVWSHSLFEGLSLLVDKKGDAIMDSKLVAGSTDLLPDFGQVSSSSNSLRC